MTQSRTAKVLVLSSGRALTSLVGIVSMAVLTRVFSKLDYATYRQTMLAYTFAVPFVRLGLDQALYFFLPGEWRRPRTLLVENLLLLTIAGVILSLFILLGGNRLLAGRLNNPDLVPTLLLLVPYPLLMLPASSLTACLMARGRTEQVAVFNVATRLFMLAFVLLPVLFWTRPGAAVAGTVAGAAVTTVAALALMFRACPCGPWRPTAAGMWRQLRFAVPLGLAGLAGTASMSVDQMLVAARCEPEVFAVFSVGALEIPLIGIVTGSITSVVIVDYARLFRERRIEEMVALIHRAMVKSGWFLLPTMVLLFCVAPELMRLLFGEQYEAAAIPFRVFLLLLPVRAITFGAILQATGNSHQVLIQSLLDLAATACFGWVGIGLFGPIGASIGSVMATYTCSVPFLIFAIHRVLRTPVKRLFPWFDLFKQLLASALPGLGVLAIFALCEMPNVIRLALGTLAYVILLPIGFLALGLVSLRNIRSAVKKLASGEALPT
jgi:O-antigen/teichoic acid export membrane protein